MTSVHFKVNCGYARVGIWQYSKVGKFKVPLASYGIDTAIFDGYGHRESPFDRYCKSITGLFQKWKHRENKRQYLHQFSPDNWKKLPTSSKRRHTISNCKECAISHSSFQECFPGPVYRPTQSLSEDVRSLIEQNRNMDVTPATTTRQILAELQPTYQKAYGVTFTESLACCSGSGVQLKQTDAERKKTQKEDPT